MPVYTANSSKSVVSPASQQQTTAYGIFYNILMCRDAIDICRIHSEFAGYVPERTRSTANLHQERRLGWFEFEHFVKRNVDSTASILSLKV
jgi:hypothetical protein